MPWSIADVDRHFKGLTEKQKENWVGIANGVLNSCLGNGGNQSECEARAVRVANDRAKGIKESRMERNPLKEIKLTILTESVLSESKVDRENRIIRNVVILSKNSVDAAGRVKRTYTEDCLDKSVSIFEGAPAYLDHPGDVEARQGRSVRDQYGFYRGVQHIAEKLVAKELVLYTGPDSDRVLDIAEKNPTSAGNSIHAAGKVKTSNGIEIVEEILPRTRWGHRSSVDLVDDPATTRGIFESREKGVTEMEDLTVQKIQEGRKDLYESIVAIGAASRDGEFKTLKEQVGTLTTENDNLKVEKALAAKKDLVEQVLRESKLPAEAITDAFRGILMNVQERKEGDKTISVEDGMKSLVEDRAGLVNPGGVKGNNGGKGKGNTGGEISLKECRNVLRRR